MRMKKRAKRGTVKSLVKEYYTYPEAAQRLGVSVSTLERLASAGKVSRLKIGGKVYFTEASLLEYMESCRRGQV